jgi:hypothetical protein
MEDPTLNMQDLTLKKAISLPLRLGSAQSNEQSIVNVHVSFSKRVIEGMTNGLFYCFRSIDICCLRSAAIVHRGDGPTSIVILQLKFAQSR